MDYLKYKHRRKRDRDTTCTSSKKIIFTKGESKRILAMRYNGVGITKKRRDECRFYYCDDCKGYHLTKNKLAWYHNIESAHIERWNKLIIQ